MTVQAQEGEQPGTSRVIRSRPALKFIVFGITALKLAPYAISGVWPLTAWQQGYGDTSFLTVLLSIVLPLACVAAALGKVELHPDRIVYLGIGGRRTVPLASITRSYAGDSSWVRYAILEGGAKRRLMLLSIEFTEADMDEVLSFVSARARQASRTVDGTMPPRQARKDRFMARFPFWLQVCLWLVVAVVVVLVMNRYQ
jgi:hypothetical protein